MATGASKKPNDTHDIDAAQAEVERSPLTLTLVDGEQFDLPGRLPYAVWRNLWNGMTDTALQKVFGDDFDRFADHADFHEVMAFVDSLPGRYGVGTMGESEASGASSNDTGEPSRPTSSGSTGSTSRKKSSARTPSPHARSSV